jgi:hypothetical protein
MSITQTVEIPDSHRLTIDVPREIPTGLTVLTFTPAAIRKMTEPEKIKYNNSNAEWLNNEAEDVLAYQNLDAFDEDLERLPPQELAAMHGAVVPFSFADIVLDHDDSRLNLASEEERQV